MRLSNKKLANPFVIKVMKALSIFAIERQKQRLYFPT